MGARIQAATGPPLLEGVNMSDKLSIIVDMIGYIQKARVSAQVRQSHLVKQNKKCDVTERLLERADEFETWLEDELAIQVKAHPAYSWFSQIKGIGNVNIGKVLGPIDIEKATQISKLWRFAGFGVNEGKGERRIKGEKLHYNSSLKSMCWRLGKSLIRAKGKYYEFYLAEKKRIGEREEQTGRKIVASASLPKEKGKHIENDEFVGLGHVDMMAMRKMIKLFLAHLWLKWREAEGLPITEPYSMGIQGHSDFISPDEMIE